MIFFHILDILLFVVFALNIAYLLFFGVASLFRSRASAPKATMDKKIAILIPAYKEDAVIMECVNSCLQQQYPRHLYEIVVISDRMTEATNTLLEGMPLTLIKVYFEESTKSKALNLAMAQLTKQYDIALVLDADNTIAPDFMGQVNNIFHLQNVHIVQAHRCAKNTNTPLALLDAVSEEINNSIFRKAHANVGLSAALIGSGMCFNYRLFKESMATIDAIGGFDRALELQLLQQGYRVDYMPQADVLDEKVQQQSDFSRQRRRWLSAQLHYMCRSIKHVPRAIVLRQWDFLDKMVQQMTIPRVMLLGFSAIITIVVTLISMVASIKWWVIVGALSVALLVSIPRRMYGRKLLIAIVRLPFFFIVVAINIFKLKGANKKFIHTSHGIKE
ncbi:MAG: glycosyltransferase family 2 protein [Mucinivorans sp.]